MTVNDVIDNPAISEQPLKPSRLSFRVNKPFRESTARVNVGKRWAGACLKVNQKLEKSLKRALLGLEPSMKEDGGRTTDPWH